MDTFTVEALWIASFGECQMGTALSRGRWYALVALDRARLSDLPCGFESAEIARQVCYLSLEVLTATKRAAGSEKHTCIPGLTQLPQFEDLEWVREANPQIWADAYFSKTAWPVTPAERTSKSSGAAAATLY